MAGGEAGREDDALLAEGFETRCLDLQRVGGGRQQTEGVAAASGGGKGSGYAVLGAGQGDDCARDDSSAGIGDDAV